MFRVSTIAALISIIFLVPTVAADSPPCNGGTERPGGGWQDTCGTDSASWNLQTYVFTANCSTVAGSNTSQSTSIDMKTCSTCDLVNINGNLRCTPLNIDIQADLQWNNDDMSLTFSSDTQCLQQDCEIQVSDDQTTVNISVADGQPAFINFIFPDGTDLSDCPIQIPPDYSCCDATPSPFTCSTTDNSSPPFVTIQDDAAPHTEKEMRFVFCLPKPNGGTACSSDPTLVTKSPTNIGDGKHHS